MFTPIFFDDVLSETQATMVNVSVGSETTGVDFFTNIVGNNTGGLVGQVLDDPEDDFWDCQASPQVTFSSGLSFLFLFLPFLVLWLQKRKFRRKE